VSFFANRSREAGDLVLVKTEMSNSVSIHVLLLMMKPYGCAVIIAAVSAFSAIVVGLLLFLTVGA
jgi:hypothetical protein